MPSESLTPPLEKLRCPCWRYPDPRGHTMHIFPAILDPDDFRDLKQMKTFRVGCSCGSSFAWRGSPEDAIAWVFRANGGETK